MGKHRHAGVPAWKLRARGRSSSWIRRWRRRRCWWWRPSVRARRGWVRAVAGAVLAALLVGSLAALALP